MKTSPDVRLQRLLGEPTLAALRQRLRRRFELSDEEETLPSIQLNNLNPVEYSALCQLTGRPSRIARSITLDITDLDARLRAAGLANSLQDALEQLDGPIVAKTRLRKTLSEQWSALTTSASAESSPILRAWLQNRATSMPLLKRLGRNPARAQQLLVATDIVLRRLPVEGRPRSQLAAETLGDAHALDTGRPVATLVLSACACTSVRVTLKKMKQQQRLAVALKSVCGRSGQEREFLSTSWPARLSFLTCQWCQTHPAPGCLASPPTSHYGNWFANNIPGK